MPGVRGSEAMSVPGCWSDRPDRPQEKRRVDPFLDLRQELIDNPGRTRRLERAEAIKVANLSPKFEDGCAATLQDRLQGRDDHVERVIPGTPRLGPLATVHGRFDGFDDPETGGVFVWYEPSAERTWWQDLMAAMRANVYWMRPLPRPRSYSPDKPTHLPSGPAPPPPPGPGRNPPPVENVERPKPPPAAPAYSVEPSVPWPRTAVLPAIDLDDCSPMPPCKPPRHSPRLGLLGEVVDYLYLLRPELAEEMESYALLYGDRTMPGPTGVLPKLPTSKVEAWGKYNPAQMVRFLEELIDLDADAMSALVAARVPCSAAFVDHLTVQVDLTPERFEVGLLGILNGLCGTFRDGTGAVAVIVEEDGRVTGAQLITESKP